MSSYNSPYYQNGSGSAYNYYAYNSQLSQSPPLPLHLCFFLLTLFSFIGFSWYMSYESSFESFVDHVKLPLMVLSLLLLLAVHWLSGDDWRRLFFFNSLFEREPPWGVAAVLVLLIFMISYQS